jgi:3-hydroxybutyryl-CoA dehydratase
MFEKGTVFQKIYSVNESVYKGFISIFQDKNPLHTNEKFAQKKGFKSIVMHGNILNGFISHFVGECLPMKNVIIHWQEIKYVLPVYLNDTLILNLSVDNYTESVNTIEFRFYFQNQNAIKVARGKLSIGII